MLLPAFYILTATVLLGLYLSLYYLGLVKRRSWFPSLLHCALAAVGVALLFASLGGAPRGAEFGVQSFGAIAGAVALAAMAVVLLYLALLMFFQKRVTWLVGLHIVVALTAYSFLLAYVVF